MSEVAPRIRRLGPDIVNSYLVEHGGEVVIVDAGVPAYWGSLAVALAAMGRTFDDVRAVLLTHGHSRPHGLCRARLDVLGSAFGSTSSTPRSPGPRSRIPPSASVRSG